MASRHSVAVVGAGVGGLACALALLQRGHDVDVYEQAHALGDVGAGVQLSPNATRCLFSLGLEPALRAVADAPAGKQARHWSSGQAWPLFELGDEAVQRFGFPFLTVHRADLHAILVEAIAALKPGAMHLASRCAGFSEGDGRVQLRLENGSTATAGLLVGADGVRSLVRAGLGHDDKPQFMGFIAWRGLAPVDALNDELRRPVGTNWIGPAGHVITYPVRGGRFMNFVGVVERADWRKESWSEQGTRDECAADFAGWHDDVHRLIQALDTPFKWALMVREPLPAWSRGCVTLLGDACHPTLPFLAQGAVMAIEDAIVLARCVDAAGGDIAAALQRYEQARRDRTTRIVAGAAEIGRRIRNPAMNDPAAAAAFVERNWSAQQVRERYHWLYEYDALSVPLQLPSGP